METARLQHPVKMPVKTEIAVPAAAVVVAVAARIVLTDPSEITGRCREVVRASARIHPASEGVVGVDAAGEMMNGLAVVLTTVPVDPAWGAPGCDVRDQFRRRLR